MSPHDLSPRIDPMRCTGCGKCVDICPTQALVQFENKATLGDANKCTSCSACEDICPSDAIALPFIVVFAPSQAAAKPSPQRLAHKRPLHPKGGSL